MLCSCLTHDLILLPLPPLPPLRDPCAALPHSTSPQPLPAAQHAGSTLPQVSLALGPTLALTISHMSSPAPVSSLDYSCPHHGLPTLDYGLPMPAHGLLTNFSRRLTTVLTVTFIRDPRNHPQQPSPWPAHVHSAILGIPDSHPRPSGPHASCPPLPLLPCPPIRLPCPVAASSNQGACCPAPHLECLPHSYAEHRAARPPYG